MSIETNVQRHQQICTELSALYEAKNHDYGDSFHKGWEKYGMTMAVIRLGDKFSRLESLALNGKSAKVTGESVRDTLIDLANYAIMTVMELDEVEYEGITKAGYETLLAERDAAVECLSKRPHHSTCKHGEHCDYISAVTGFPDCYSCDEWEWIGPQEGDAT